MLRGGAASVNKADRISSGEIASNELNLSQRRNRNAAHSIFDVARQRQWPAAIETAKRLVTSVSQ